MSILFGKYQLLERIKTGGMAEIWLAKEQGIEDFERLVVIKKVLPGLSEDKNFIEMFLDEGRLAAKLNHPNIVQIYELDKVDDSYYIAMEYISGVNLEELRRKLNTVKKIPLPYICRIVSNVAKGLHFAHVSKDLYGKPLNIVHRDISPHNVLITYEGDVKIVDFGIAKAETQSNKTKTGTFKGKVSYLSPEQISGTVLDARSDVFALGIVLYELCTGYRLFKGKSDINIIRMIADMPVAAPHITNRNFPVKLSSIIMKALEKDVENRYQSAHELQSDLEEYLASEKHDNLDLEIPKWLNVIFKKQIVETKEHYQALIDKEETIVRVEKKKKKNKMYLFVFMITLLSVLGAFFIPKLVKNFQTENKNLVTTPIKKIVKKSPCETHKCNLNQQCVLNNNKAICVCDYGYYSSNNKCLKKYNLRLINGTKKDIATSIALDSKGNRYIAGYFYESISLNDKVYKAKSKNKSDIFITKIDKNDKHIWTRVIGGKWNDYPEKVAVDKFDNIYITGAFSGTVDFNSKEGTDKKSSQGLLDIFLTKINADGTYAWTKTFGGKDYLDRGTSIAFDKDNNIYLGAWFSGTEVEVYSHKNIVVNISSKGSSDILVLKLDNNGKYLWDYSLGSKDSDGVTDLVVNEDKLYVTGFFSDEINLNDKTYKSIGKEDIILFTLDLKTGKPSIVKTFGTLGSDRANSFVIDKNEIYISGYLGEDFTDKDNNILKNRGYTDIFIAKLNKNAEFNWFKTIGGRGEDAAIDMFKHNDKLYLTGWFQYGVDFDPSENTDLKPSYGSRDIFITTFDLKGKYLNTLILGGEQQDKSMGLTIDKNNNLHLIGWFKGTIDFDFSEEKDHHTSKGLEDAFILRWHLE